MLRNRKKLILKTLSFSFLILLALWRNGFCDTSQAWFKNTATFSLSSRWSPELSHETRNVDITFFNPYKKNFAGGFVFHLSNNFTLSAVYKREHVEIQDIHYNENRITLEAGWETEVTNNLDFEIYFRTEIREFDEQFVEDHLRFRFRIMLITELNLGNLKIKPFIGNETFGKTKIYTVENNRLYLGTLIPLSENVELGLAYIWLSTRGAESIHILHSGFRLKF